MSTMAAVKASAASTNNGAGSTIRVVSMRTGLPMETLRAWERRYGFPAPERRPGSNRRLYSAADVDRLAAIRLAIARGFRVGDVIDKPLVELRVLADQAERGAAISETRGTSPESSVSRLLALLAEDRVPELEGELRRVASALGPKSFAVDIAHPFAVEVGAGWERGELSVRHEHLATECLVTQLRHMLSTYQDIEARPRVLLATVPGESHTLPLQIVALYLIAIGATPRLMGGSAPPTEIVDAAIALGADAVGLTVTPTCDRTHARRDLKTMRRSLPAGLPVWIGGAGAAALGIADANTHVVTSWAAIDAVVAHTRGSRRIRR